MVCRVSLLGWHTVQPVRCHSTGIRATFGLRVASTDCHRDRIQNRFPLDPLYSINSDIPFKLKKANGARFEWAISVASFSNAYFNLQRSERALMMSACLDVIDFGK